MKIDRKLNISIPVEIGEVTYYVYSTPISREVFERYFMVISKTFAALYSEGLSVIAGPRVAAMLLKDMARRMGVWEGPEGVEAGLMAEIYRLTNVFMPNPDGAGWKSMPFADVINRKLFDDDALSEIEGAIVFFMLASAMHKKTEVAGILAGMASLWGAEVTSSDFTEYRNSLPTLMTEDATTKKVKASSIPT